MESQRDIAMGLMQQRRFAEALPLFVRLIDSSPEDWSLHYMAGQCFRFSNRLPESVQSLSKAASLNPDEPQVFLALGIARQLTEKYKLALDAFEEAVRLDPKLFSAYNSIGLTYKKMGDFRKALEWYSRASEILFAAVSEEVLNEREKCFQEVSMDENKELVLLPYLLEKTHEILRSEPSYSFLKNNIGVCLLELGDMDAAREQFTESIEFIPEGYEYPNPYKNLESIG
jgi:tetratricopeptide (TPR) repeat protein